MEAPEGPLPIFVYGTLRPGDVGFVEAGLEGRVQVLGTARVAGSLYDLGDYPGFVAGGSGIVSGELLLPLDDGVLPLLDAYELYDPLDPTASEYLRCRIKTVDDAISVWIYVYNRPVTTARQLIHGDWFAR